MSKTYKKTDAPKTKKQFRINPEKTPLKVIIKKIESPQKNIKDGISKIKNFEDMTLTEIRDYVESL